MRTNYGPAYWSLTVERHRARSLRAVLAPWAYTVALVVAAALAVTVFLSLVTAVHRARAAEADACRAWVAAFVTRNPALAAGVPRLADSCRTRRALEGGREP